MQKHLEHVFVASSRNLTSVTPQDLNHLMTRRHCMAQDEVKQLSVLMRRVQCAKMVALGALTEDMIADEAPLAFVTPAKSKPIVDEVFGEGLLSTENERAGHEQTTTTCAASL